KLIIGLRNPGPEYVRTRHNLGAEAVLALASRMRVHLSHTTLHAEWGRGYAQGQNVILATPSLYMNCSGRTVTALVKYFKSPLEKILVVVDDFNLPLQTLRFRAEGSAGGHNGLKSIIGSLGTQTFHRLRLGIGNPPAGMEITDYVLGRFRREERVQAEKTIAKAAEAAWCWLTQGITRAMTEYN
ncbi:aminoacyl-tRNA hydrolase, partial [candidate division FCPU426 bacterium]|nr:aminoacyl-tRNA hydrolase [candidate division FCPU426 bacterium]